MMSAEVLPIGEAWPTRPCTSPTEWVAYSTVLTDHFPCEILCTIIVKDHSRKVRQDDGEDYDPKPNEDDDLGVIHVNVTREPRNAIRSRTRSSAVDIRGFVPVSQ